MANDDDEDSPLVLTIVDESSNQAQHLHSQASSNSWKKKSMKINLPQSAHVRKRQMRLLAFRRIFNSHL